nr:hypothetical protein CFP56_35277 [Quercus suber]
MASSTSILPNTSIPLDDQCSNYQLNQKDQASSIVESSLVQPNTPPLLPPSDWGSTQFMTADSVHQPQQNLSTPPPPNHGSFHIPMAEPNVAQPQNNVPADQYYIVHVNDPSTLSHQNSSIPPPNQDFNSQQSQTISIVIPPSSDQPSPSFTINPQQNQNPASTTVPPNWRSTQYINTGPYLPQQPNNLGLCQYSTAELNLVQPNPSLPPQNHAPWSRPCILHIDPSNLPPTSQQDSSNTQQSVIAEASEPTSYSLNPPSPCIFMVSAPQPTNGNTYTPPSSLSTPLLKHGSNPMSGSLLGNAKGSTSTSSEWSLCFVLPLVSSLPSLIASWLATNYTMVLPLSKTFGSSTTYTTVTTQMKISDVLHCFFPHGGENQYSMVLYLPLVAGVLSSFLFSICPTERKGFGYADSNANPRAEPNLAIQNHVPWSLQWILRIDPSNLLPQIQDFNNQQSPAAISAVKVQPSEPITYNLNPPAIFVVSSNSQQNISAPPPSQSSNPTNVPNQENTVSEPSNTSKPALPQGPQQQTYGNSQKRNMANKAANLANLLPTGTVLLFQALTPSLANSTGKCQYFNKYLIGSLIIICAATCFLSSFTDSFMVDNKLFFGFATFKDFWVLNYDSVTSQDVETKVRENTKKHKIIPKDYVHAFGSLLVFLIFAFSSSDVLHCFFPDGGENRYSMVLYLPLVSGVLSSFLFSLFPTQRKGFGYGDTIPVPHY